MQLIAYILVYPILWLISILPFRLLYAFSDLLYIFLYKIFGYRKSTVKNNLQLVFPDKSDKEIRDITSQFYHHLCDMMVEAIKSLTISKKEIVSITPLSSFSPIMERAPKLWFVAMVTIQPLHSGQRQLILASALVGQLLPTPPSKNTKPGLMKVESPLP